MAAPPCRRRGPRRDGRARTADAILGRLDRDPTSAGDAELAPAAACGAFAGWFESRRERLDPPAADAAIELLRNVRSNDLRVWLALRLMVLAPRHLAWKLQPLFHLSGPIAQDLAPALRTLALTRRVDSREACMKWLAWVGGFVLPDDGFALLESSSKALRALGTSLVESLPPTAVAGADTKLAKLAARERNVTSPRALAKLARAARTSDVIIADRSVASLASAIVVEWDAGGGRPKAKKLLDELAKHSSGWPWLAHLARTASSADLRRECAGRADALGASAGSEAAGALDAALCKAVTEDGSGLTHEITARAEDAMCNGRPVALAFARVAAGDETLIARTPEHPLLRVMRTALDDEEGAPVVLDDATLVVLVHPLDLTEVQLQSLRRRKLRQPFEQIERAVFRVPPHLASSDQIEIPGQHWRTARAWWARGGSRSTTTTIGTPSPANP